MTDVLKNVAPADLAAWYGRLADDIALRGKAKGIPNSLAAILMKRWLNTGGKGKLIIEAPPHLKRNSYVKETLKYHRSVYLTEKKARLGRRPSQREVWAGIIPRLQSGRWSGRGRLDIYYESLAEVPVSVQAKAWLGLGNPGDLDLLYSLHGFQLRSEVTVSSRPKPGSSLLTIKFEKFHAKALDRYDWDPTKYITVPNPDYRKSFDGAIEPRSEKITVYHTNAKRLEKAGMAKPFDLETKSWSIADRDICGAGQVDPKKRL